MLKYTGVLFTTLLSSSVLAENLSKFEITYIDAEGKGAFSAEPFTTGDGTETTLGEHRQALLEYVTRAVSLQFNHGPIAHELHVEFDVWEGYAATTLGPVYGEVSEGSRTDKFGVMQMGSSYPGTLVSALLSADYQADEDALVSFMPDLDTFTASGDDKHPSFVYAAYHEMMHVLGFGTTDCLGNCIPAPVSHDGHLSPYLYYNDGGIIKEFESLNIEQKTDAYKSTDAFWFGGTQASRDAANAELTSGHQDGYVYMHATPYPATGNVDPQAGSHFSFDVQPAQLMYSTNARTEDIGMAAYLLCDVGWCRNQGKVIEQSVEATLNENASTETESIIDIVVKENLNLGVDNFVLNIRPDAATQVLSLEDPDGLCEVVTEGYQCKGQLLPLAQIDLKLIVTPAEQHVINGEIYSTGFDVDRNGFNNILDAKLAKAKVVETPDPETPTATTPTPIVQSNDSGGGALTLLLIPMLLIAFLRRTKLKFNYR
jgi:hypothetical protein